MKVIYNFNNSSESIQEWWWHLNKVVNKTLTIDFESQIIVYNRQTYQL
ncbi:hypothetical protein SAM19_05153 [Brevibacillus laterosporus]|nr:hypothetical protein [Brevibacillus laterosporus]